MRPGGLALAMLVTALFLAGCGGSKSKVAGPPSTPFTIRLSATTAGAEKIRVRGTSNLPNGSVITISSARAFKYERESVDRDSFASAEKNATVSHGRYSTLLLLTDTSSVKAVADDLPDPQYGAVSVIDSAVLVCADFETGPNLSSGKAYQPDVAVSNVVGANGENLTTSRQAIKFGPKPSYWLEVSHRFATQSPLVQLVDAKQVPPARLARLAGFCAP